MSYVNVMLKRVLLNFTIGELFLVRFIEVPCLNSDLTVDVNV